MQIKFSLLLFILSLAVSGQTVKPTVTKKVFGISLQPNYQGLITYAILSLDSNGKIVNKKFLSSRDWFMQITGLEQSEANPEGKNLLKEAGIEGPDVLYDLWKLRYSEPPYEGEKEKGWAANPRSPNAEQMKMLSRFGINILSDYVYGQNLYDLLNAMEDPAWVNEYQNK
jgi:hypothetical protein